jgi:hypothetical protein
VRRIEQQNGSFYGIFSGDLKSLKSKSIKAALKKVLHLIE